MKDFRNCDNPIGKLDELRESQESTPVSNHDYDFNYEDKLS